jgi:hypothetical protein
MLDGLTRETIVWAQPTLMPLLATLPGRQRLLLPLHEGTPEVDYDVDLEIMELGHALRLRLDAVGAMVPYFDVPRGPRLSGRLCVGLSAAAGDWDDRRAIPPDVLRPILEVESVDLFSLQLGRPLAGMRDLSTPDILQVATRMRALDLVIAPDTMLAHLAGALAVPVWTLLPHDADWRWLQPDRTDCPWYPTMRLFRQHQPGDWRGVIEDVVAALRVL